MVGIWIDQFNRQRKFLSCSLFDSNNNIVRCKRINGYSVNPTKEMIQIRWKMCLDMNNYIPLSYTGFGMINAPFIPVMVTNVIEDSWIVIKPSSETSNNISHMNIVKDD